MAFVRQRPADAPTADPAIQAKTHLARYRGSACGVTYAEAVWAMQHRPVDLL
jgi:hypothetical protein